MGATTNKLGGWAVGWLGAYQKGYEPVVEAMFSCRLGIATASGSRVTVVRLG